MQLDETLFHAVLEEMITENPLAVRGALRILSTEFTDKVPTLAVTLEENPRLLVNLDFMREHCETEAHVKACIAHEFLHVLLGHTERFREMTTIQNLALDTVINAVIHRTLGVEYSSFFSKLYAGQTGLGKLLRPMTEEEWQANRWRLVEFKIFDGALEGESWDLEEVWVAVYRGKLVADDILEIAEQLAAEGKPVSGIRFVGNHEPHDFRLPEKLQRALDECMRQMNGDGIWRSPKDRGVGTLGYETTFDAGREDLELWKRRTFEVLRRCVVPDPRSILTERAERAYRLPVLSPRDRRAFLRSMWSPVLPEADWSSSFERPLGSANVYLDVSGSMNQEMPVVIALLANLRRAIRMPFWAFSDSVEPATIKNGRLVTKTTGGTSMECVIRHLAKTRPAAAVVVTDGYIEKLEPSLMKSVAGIRIHAILTRDGSPAQLKRAGIPYSQLERYPHG